MAISLSINLSKKFFSMNLKFVNIDVF